MRRSHLDALLLPDGSMRIMIATLEREGLDPSPAISAAGFDPSSRTLQRQVSPEQELAFQRAFREITGYRPDLWFRMGMDYTLAAFGQFALVIMTAPNLRVLLTNPDLGRFGFHGLKLRPIVIHHRLIGIELDASQVDDDMRDMALLVSLGCVLRFYPELVGDDFAFTLVCLPFSDPDGRLREIAGVPLSLNADRALALWPDAQSERPLRNANPVLYEAYTAAARSLLDAPVTGEDFRARVSGAIASHLSEPALLETVAGSLGLTARTLQRRLSRAGLKFRTMVDQCRREAAIQTLVFGDAPLTQVAWGLGYTDLASFAHAFQRWTGSTPGRFRRQARGEDGEDATARR